jgi:hypothetical protein
MPDNIELLKDGLPGALVTASIIAAHEIAHFAVAKAKAIKLGVPYFVPSWQVCLLYFYKLFCSKHTPASIYPFCS